MRVLIADDSRSDRLLLQHTLVRWGYEVVACENGREALEILAERDLSLAILDWMMPELDGVEVCRRSRALGRIVYVILLTGRDSLEELISALQAGADDYLVKPFQPQELRARLLVGERLVRRQIELLHLRKMESLGNIAAGVAHELNTPTQYLQDNLLFVEEGVSCLARMLERQSPLLEVVKKAGIAEGLVEELEELAEQLDVAYYLDEIPGALQQAREGVERIGTLVKAMSELSGANASVRRAVDLNEVVHSVVALWRERWSGVAEIELELDPALPPVTIRSSEIAQVLVSLMVNAVDAIAGRRSQDEGERGRIVVRTSRGEGWVQVCVQDDGDGIPEAIRDRIFDPFFTTKSVGAGTGQGLALAHSIVVEQHGGRLTFESREGQGSTFRVELPLGNRDSDGGARS
ncbi:MAG: sensor histidine kinase [Myxococcota bacterium]